MPDYEVTLKFTVSTTEEQEEKCRRDGRDPQDAVWNRLFSDLRRTPLPSLLDGWECSLRDEHADGDGEDSRRGLTAPAAREDQNAVLTYEEKSSQ